MASERNIMTRLANIEDEIARLRRRDAGELDSRTRQIKALSRDIQRLVPVIASDADVPADIYWCHPGAGLDGNWTNSSGVTTEQWDSTDMRFYGAMTAGTDWLQGTIRQAWPTGPFGSAHSFEPKEISVTKCVLDFRAKFVNNVDYTTVGIGLIDESTGAINAFDTATDHFIQVLRNTTAWELGTCDGATISQSSGGTADGNFHDFRVVWETSRVTLFVDEVSTIIKTTNLPAEPLALNILADAATQLGVMGIKISWE